METLISEGVAPTPEDEFIVGPNIVTLLIASLALLVTRWVWFVGVLDVVWYSLFRNVCGVAFFKHP
jgi:hypothetical protein